MKNNKDKPAPGQITSCRYNVHKVAEGGIGQSHAIFLARDCGMRAKGDTSIFVGQTCVIAYGTPRQHRKLNKALYG